MIAWNLEILLGNLLVFRQHKPLTDRRGGHSVKLTKWLNKQSFSDFFNIEKRRHTYCFANLFRALDNPLGAFVFVFPSFASNFPLFSPLFPVFFCPFVSFTLPCCFLCKSKCKQTKFWEGQKLLLRGTKRKLPFPLLLCLHPLIVWLLLPLVRTLFHLLKVFLCGRRCLILLLILPPSS